MQPHLVDRDSAKIHKRQQNIGHKTKCQKRGIGDTINKIQKTIKYG